MTRYTKIGGALAAALLLGACQERPETQVGGTADAAPEAAPVAPAGEPADRPRALLAVSDAQPPHLTDDAGQAVYTLAGNRQGERCDAACEEAWPPVVAQDAQPAAGPGVPQGAIATMPRADGGHHATYRGEPLYRYAADQGAGRTAGDGVEDQWGRWSLVRIDPAGTGAPAGE